jgi:ketosteroid isomerase-like protein
MSQQNIESVKRLFDAVARRDQAGLLEAYHPEIVIHEAPSLPYGGKYRGHQGAIEHVNGFYRTWEALKPRELLEEAVREHPPIALETTQEYVVVMARNMAVAPRSRSKLDLPEVFVFRVQDGRVIESWMFHQDTVAILEFLKEAQQEIP